MTVQTIGQAFIAINPDTTKTGAAINAAMVPIGAKAGATLQTGITNGITVGSTQGSAAFSKFAGVLQQGAGSALAPIAMLGEHFSGLGESIKQNGILSAQGFTAMGTGVAGAGIALMTLGSADKQANAQLQASIRATGGDYDNFKGKIEEAITSEEHFGHSASDTQNALATLTTITGDAGKATDYIGVAANLAAARHISLTSAATQVGRSVEGNTRLFKLYGVEVTKNADGTKNIDKAMSDLSAKLDGQASASVSGFTGQMKVLTVQVEDQVAKFGQKYGPAITAAGAAMGLLGGAAQLASKGLELIRGGTEAASAATEADIAITEASTAAVAADAETATTAAIAETSLGASEARAATAALGAGVANEQLALFNTEVATTATEAAVATEAEGAAAKGSMLGMAAGAGVAGIALVGVGLVINKVMGDSRKQAEESKKAFDAYWASISANRSQTSLSDLQAEVSDLNTSLADQVSQVEKGTFAHTTWAKVLENNMQHHSAFSKQIDELNAKIKTEQGNIDSLSTEFKMSGQAVQDLADKNNIDLSGSLDGIDTKFQKLLGGTEAVISQLATLNTQYEVSGTAIDDFAKKQQITLDGTAASTAAFRAAVTTNEQVGTQTQILASDYDALSSSLTTATDKESAFKSLLDQLLGSNISAAQMVDDFQLKINDLGTTLDSSTRSLDRYSDGGIKNKKVIEDLIQNAITAADATYKQSGSVDAASATYAEYYNKIISAANANGINQASLTALVTSLGGLPQQVADGLGATVGVASAAGSSAVTAFADTLGSPDSTGQIIKSTAVISDAVSSNFGANMYAAGQAAADSLIGGYTAGVTANLSIVGRITSQVPAAARAGLSTGGSGTYPGRASGGPVGAGMAYTVGEHGPETLHMGSMGGVIVPSGGGANGLDFSRMIALLESIDAGMSSSVAATHGVKAAVQNSDGGMSALTGEILAGRR